MSLLHLREFLMWMQSIWMASKCLLKKHWREYETVNVFVLLSARRVKNVECPVPNQSRDDFSWIFETSFPNSEVKFSVTISDLRRRLTSNLMNWFFYFLHFSRFPNPSTKLPNIIHTLKRVELISTWYITWIGATSRWLIWEKQPVSILCTLKSWSHSELLISRMQWISFDFPGFRSIYI